MPCPGGLVGPVAGCCGARPRPGDVVGYSATLPLRHRVPLICGKQLSTGPVERSMADHGLVPEGCIALCVARERKRPRLIKPRDSVGRIVYTCSKPVL